MTEAFRAEKGAAAASSYRVDGDTITPVTASVGNGRSEICWAVISNDGRFAFTTNFADGAVSRYAIGMGGALTLEDATAGVTEDGRPGLRDEDLSDDGGSCTRSTPTRARSSAWSVDEAGASRWPAPGSGVPTTVAGLAASLMQLEPFYRVTFTTPESWSVTREGGVRCRGTELPDRRGARRGPPLGEVPRRELPAPSRRRRARARVPRRAGDRRRRDDPVPLGRARDG